eukprot:1717923-Alexandrium_andersonii.AAC.1
MPSSGEEEEDRGACHPAGAHARGTVRREGYECTLEGTWWRRVTLVDLHGITFVRNPLARRVWEGLRSSPFVVACAPPSPPPSWPSF